MSLIHWLADHNNYKMESKSYKDLFGWGKALNLALWWKVGMMLVEIFGFNNIQIIK